MAGDAQQITIKPAASRAQAGQVLARVEPVAVDGATVAEMIAGCRVFQIEQAGQAVGAIAARMQDTEAGRLLEVTAAAASTEAGGVDAILSWAEDIAKTHGVKRLSCTTARRGLVRKLERRGFKVAGYIMTKGA